MKAQVENYFVIGGDDCVYFCVRDGLEDLGILDFLNCVALQFGGSIFHGNVKYNKVEVSKELAWSVGDILTNRFGMVVIDYNVEVGISDVGISLVEAFDRAAQNWCLISEEGYGIEVDKSENKYYHAKNDLITYILELEQKVESYEGK